MSKMPTAKAFRQFSAQRTYIGTMDSHIDSKTTTPAEIARGGAHREGASASSLDAPDSESLVCGDSMGCKWRPLTIDLVDVTAATRKQYVRESTTGGISWAICTSR